MKNYKKILILIAVNIAIVLSAYQLRIMRMSGMGSLLILSYIWAGISVIYFLKLLDFEKRQFYFLSVSATLLVLGLLRHRMHWIGGGLLITTGCGLTIIFYIIRFIQKVKKQSLDYIKLIMVISYCILTFAIKLHWILPIIHESYIFVGLHIVLLALLLATLENKRNANTM